MTTSEIMLIFYSFFAAEYQEFNSCLEIGILFKCQFFVLIQLNKFGFLQFYLKKCQNDVAITIF